jgi:hypothetical protein
VTQLSEHPSVKRFYETRTKLDEMPKDRVLDAAWLRQLCLDAGADDVGFVEHDRPWPMIESSKQNGHQRRISPAQAAQSNPDLQWLVKSGIT